MSDSVQNPHLKIPQYCKGTTCPVIPTLLDDTSGPPSASPFPCPTSMTTANDVHTHRNTPNTSDASPKTFEARRGPSTSPRSPSIPLDPLRDPSTSRRSPSEAFVHTSRLR